MVLWCIGILIPCMFLQEPNGSFFPQSRFGVVGSHNSSEINLREPINVSDLLPLSNAQSSWIIERLTNRRYFVRTSSVQQRIEHVSINLDSHRKGKPSEEERQWPGLDPFR